MCQFYQALKCLKLSRALQIHCQKHVILLAFELSIGYLSLTSQMFSNERKTGAPEVSIREILVDEPDYTITEFRCKQFSCFHNITLLLRFETSKLLSKRHYIDILYHSSKNRDKAAILVHSAWLSNIVT